MTDIQITPKWHEVKPDGYYVYLHRRSSDGSVFYVGKGKFDRAWEASGRNSRWTRTARKCGVRVDIVSSSMTECCALTLEKIVISMFDFDDLSNITKGGDGTSGMSHSDETIASMARTIYCSNGMSFISSGKAEKWLIENVNRKASRSAVLACCNGRISSCYGFTWSWIYPAPKFVRRGDVPYSRYVRKKVSCSNGMTFDSISDAARWIDPSRVKAVSASITTCAKGRQKTAYGFKWKYVVDR